MARTIDADSIFNKCLRPLVSERLTATTVATYIDSPFAIHCDKFVSEKEKDPMSKYQQLLFDRGKAHETQTVENKYPEMAPIHFDTPEDGFKLALHSMMSGIKAMHGMPVFYLPEGLVGFVDVLEKSDAASSVFGNHHYIVKEIKLAKNIKEHHIIQGAFYNYMLGKIQGVTPPTFYVINRDGEEIPYQYSEYEEVLHEAVDGTRRILQGEHVSPTYGSCQFPWESYCNRMAEETNDISLVPEIGLKRKYKMIECGFKTVSELADADAQKLMKVKGIGTKTAPKFIYAAKAIQSKEPIVKDKSAIVFPRCKTEIFLDLEGTDPSMIGEEIIQVDYLIGILVRTDSKEEYVPFVASSLGHEQEMLFKFLEFMQKQKDYVIYHYHHYEKIHLNKMMERYGVDEETRSGIFDHMLDVYKIASDAVSFPTYGNGLKPVARFLGFSWRHKDVDATESIAMYLDYVKNPESNKDKLQKILDYNEDDCIATKVIKDWLNAIHS